VIVDLKRIATFPVLALLLVSPVVRAQNPAPLSPEEQEKFLKSARIVKTKAAAKGITGTTRITLSDGTFTHDAHVQSIDESKATYQTDSGTELNFRDTYKYNIAAYRLAALLGIGDRLPMSVERKVNGSASATTWWVDNVKFDEAQRLHDKIEPPDVDRWNDQIAVMRVFDQLIANTDRNLTNLVIDNNWKIWMIDHTRAFRLRHDLLNPKNLTRCDRNLLAKMKELDMATLQKTLSPYLTKPEMEGVLARRDVIVKFFESEVQKKGDAAVLYTQTKS
jgi:hypothetical protein